MGRPGIGRMLVGLYTVGMVAVCARHGPPPGRDPVWVLLALTGLLAAGVLMVRWGWGRLHRAKSEHPQLTWWQFLHTEVVALALLVGIAVVLLAVGEDGRQTFLAAVLSLYELRDQVGVARGGP